MRQSKILSMLGLSKKAGKVVSGEFMVEKTVRAGQAKLVVIAEDASANSRKNFTDMCTYYKVPMVIAETKETLGHAIGCEMRVSAAVLDEGLAKSILKDYPSCLDQDGKD